MKNFIALDLDGTLCDISHRVHYAQAKMWDEFHAAIPQDQLVLTTINIIEALSNHFDFIIVTGRHEDTRMLTERWLFDNGVEEISHLLMRPNGNKMTDGELKEFLLTEHFGSLENALRNVDLILDDKDAVVEHLRDKGFVCWQVSAGSY